MKKASRMIRVLLAGAVTASFTSCAAGLTYPVTVDGDQLRAGIYILEQQSAFSSAASKLSEEQPDLDTSADGFSYFNQTVEGVALREWVNTKTIDNCREYVAVERLFAENGLSLSAETLSEINSEIKSLWNDENMYAQYFYGVDIVGDYYESLGIGEQSYKDFRTNSEKRTELFDHLYKNGGPEAVSDKEIDAKLKENYAAVNYFEYDLENGDGAQSYADRIKNGESYEEVYKSYREASERERIQGEMDEATANGEEYDGDSLDSIDIELPETDSLIQIKQKTDTSPSEDFITQLFEMSENETKVISVTSGEGDSAVTTEYVVSKLAILDKPSLTESYRDTIIHELKDDEFEAKIKTKGSSFTVTEDSSKNMYKLEKFVSDKK